MILFKKFSNFIDFHFKGFTKQNTAFLSKTLYFLTNRPKILFRI